ncbi:Os07g0273000 [Oryza sativa Japonica Group]|uniref:Os07g0273000 protein n=1 Tax=Oryza sativa subsp. japonica TaxID=39947 RepID=Q6Z4J2_ORYSJ|nr:unknown protein [Oryza sativa Japonica Group]BAD31862.1 unknown protein [Oryza sativa Japonica Group]BAF21265.1 Os07g0273000 [Oryza sativa Japonica Group]|eukprot:NP_001059351.1 Os07g0273000 [Oryza sativa Japonica Group]
MARRGSGDNGGGKGWPARRLMVRGASPLSPSSPRGSAGEVEAGAEAGVARWQ